METVGELGKEKTERIFPCEQILERQTYKKNHNLLASSFHCGVAMIPWRDGIHENQKGKK